MYVFLDKMRFRHHTAVKCLIKQLVSNSGECCSSYRWTPGGAVRRRRHTPKYTNEEEDCGSTKKKKKKKKEDCGSGSTRWNWELRVSIYSSKERVKNKKTMDGRGFGSGRYYFYVADTKKEQRCYVMPGALSPFRVSIEPGLLLAVSR